MGCGYRYPWYSDHPFPKKLLWVVILITTILVAALLATAPLKGVPALDKDGLLNASALKGVTTVTVVYAVLIEALVGTQVMLRRRNSIELLEAGLTRIGQRSLYNTLEQAVPFLAFLWSYAVFVNTQGATVLGAAYVSARFFYFITYCWFGVFTILVEFVTQFCYTIQSLLLFGFLLSSATSDAVADASAGPVTSFGISSAAIALWWIFVWLAYGVPASTLAANAITWKLERDAEKEPLIEAKRYVS